MPDTTAVDSAARLPAEAGVAALTAAVARGEEPAITAFYRRFFDLLYAHARQVTRRDESFCLDVVQDALLRIVRILRPVQTETQLAAWLRIVVQSVAYDALRRQRRREAREAHAGARQTGSASDPAAAAVNDERLAWLRRQLDALDPELVRLIELRYVQEWTLARIAARLGLSTGTVDGRLRRALRRMRDAAEDEAHE